METQVGVRQRLLAKRQSLDLAEVSQKSRLILDRLMAMNINDISRIALYSSIQNEVETDGIFGGLSRLGKTVFYPRVEGEELEFVQVHDLSKMEEGRWGILEPKGGLMGGLMGGLITSPQELEMVVIPGVAFDELGHRIGYGRGYYDRFLGRYTGRKVGLAFDFQVLKRIPIKQGDVCCDYVVTEERLISAHPC